MSGMQRRKGQRGELEAATVLAGVTGLSVTRRVRQHEGDSDLLGVGSWAIEVKRAAAATPAAVRVWWRQAVEQAVQAGGRPLLLYRADRGPWRALWAPNGGGEYLDTVEADPALWWAMTRVQP